MWFYVVESANTTVSAGYIAKDDEIIYVATTTDEATKVRPYGNNVPYPVPADWNSTLTHGFEIEFDAGAIGTFHFNASSTNLVKDGGIYSRWVGTVTGGLDGEAECNGTGLWEQMNHNAQGE